MPPVLYNWFQNIEFAYPWMFALLAVGAGDDIVVHKTESTANKFVADFFCKIVWRNAFIQNSIQACALYSPAA